MKHTAGPWKAEKIRDAIPYDWRIASTEGLEIGTVNDWVDGRRDAGLGEPNARLIAAAPEMYDFVLGLSRLGTGHFADPNSIAEIRAETRALLAKIDGAA